MHIYIYTHNSCEMTTFPYSFVYAEGWNGIFLQGGISQEASGVCDLCFRWCSCRCDLRQVCVDIGSCSCSKLLAVREPPNMPEFAPCRSWCPTAVVRLWASIEAWILNLSVGYLAKWTTVSDCIFKILKSDRYMSAEPYLRSEWSQKGTWWSWIEFLPTCPISRSGRHSDWIFSTHGTLSFTYFHKCKRLLSIGGFYKVQLCWWLTVWVVYMEKQPAAGYCEFVEENEEPADRSQLFAWNQQIHMERVG